MEFRSTNKGYEGYLGINYNESGYLVRSAKPFF